MLKAAAETQSSDGIEFLSRPARPERRSSALAKQHGVKIVINTDSHHTSHMEKMRYGITQARRAWLTKDDVLNTLPAAEFARAMKHGW